MKVNPIQYFFSIPYLFVAMQVINFATAIKTKCKRI